MTEFWSRLFAGWHVFGAVIGLFILMGLYDSERFFRIVRTLMLVFALYCMAASHYWGLRWQPPHPPFGEMFVQAAEQEGVRGVVLFSLFNYWPWWVMLLGTFIFIRAGLDILLPEEFWDAMDLLVRRRYQALRRRFAQRPGSGDRRR